jgi:hypothetical protein
LTSRELAESVRTDLDRVGRALYHAYVTEAGAPKRREALRTFLLAKASLARRLGRFGVVNNRVFRNQQHLVVPYISGDELIIESVAPDRCTTLASERFPPGTIFTDDSLRKLGGFAGEAVDIERDIFRFAIAEEPPIQIARIRDMAAQLARINASTNRNEALYVLRSLVARLSSLPFKALLGAKNLQPEVHNLISELVAFLNGPLAQRVPLLVRILVRNTSGLVLKPKLIDRLWNDAIELQEVHITGSDIAKELRRSLHHTMGLRTLALARAYLLYFEEGETRELAALGYDEPGPADERARTEEIPRRLLARLVDDLEDLLGAAEMVTRIQDWRQEYETALVGCDTGRSLVDEVEAAIAKGIESRNRWVYLRQLRTLRGKAEGFAQAPEVAAAFTAQLEELQRTAPDDASFRPEDATRSLREGVAALTTDLRSRYVADLERQLADVLALHEQGDFRASFARLHDFRFAVAEEIAAGGFTERRYFLHELDCLLEEMGYVALAHVATEYVESGVKIGECLTLIRTAIANLSLDGLHSRELIDFADMLGDPSRTYAETADLLAAIQRSFHKILRRIISPFELFRERLGLDEDELRKVLANLQRYLHDLNVMVHFCDLARTHLRDCGADPAARIWGREKETELRAARHPWDILHISRRDEIRARIEKRDGGVSLRELYGGKGAGLLYISVLGEPTRDGFILPTAIPRSGALDAEPGRLERELAAHLDVLEEDIALQGGGAKRFGDPASPLLLAVRGGSVFSMPGILQTVVFVGMNDGVAGKLAQEDPWYAYDAYRRFLASYADAVWEVDVERYGLVEQAKKRHGARAKDELPWEGMREVAEETKTLLEDLGHGDELAALLAEPQRQVAGAVRAVFASWERATARRYRDISGLCPVWHTAAIVQEMASGNRRNERVTPGMDETKASLTGVIPRTQLLERGGLVFAGEIKFSAAGDDLVGGVTSSGSFQTISELGQLMPMLDRRLHHITSKLRNFFGMDQEIEFTVERGVLSVLQSRSAEISEETEPRAFAEPGPEATRGMGIRGSAFRGLAAFDEDDWSELATGDLVGRDDVDGVLMLMENPTPDDIPLILCVDGLLTAKGGSSSHAAVAINGCEKKRYTAVMSAAGLRVNAAQHEAVICDADGEVRDRIHKGDVVSLHGTTGQVYVGSRPLRS